MIHLGDITRTTTFTYDEKTGEITFTSKLWYGKAISQGHEKSCPCCIKSYEKVFLTSQ